MSDDTEIAHVGLHAARLARGGIASLRERVFAEQWKKQQRHHLLESLLSPTNHRAAVSSRDAQVAATVIQWLGSSVGQDFLETVNEAVLSAQAGKGRG